MTNFLDTASHLIHPKPIKNKLNSTNNSINFYQMTKNEMDDELGRVFLSTSSLNNVKIFCKLKETLRVHHRYEKFMNENFNLAPVNMDLA